MKKLLSFFLDKKLCYKCAKTCSGDMKENNFTDTDFSRFTSLFSLKRSGATHVALCDSVGSYYRHWCGAFTLAEVLVTLGIIGVVSAMTVPTLMQNYQRQSYVTQLHKVYNEVQQASLRYMTDKNAINLREAGLGTQAEMANFTHTYFKVVSDCGSYVKAPCFPTSYRSLSGTETATNNANWSAASSVVLASGASIVIDYPNVYTKTVNGVTSHYGHMLIDINGPKGPNIGGRDMFYAEFYDDGSIDVAGATPECKANGVCDGDSLTAIRDTLYNSSCSSTWQGQGCLGKIINDGWTMTY